MLIENVWFFPLLAAEESYYKSCKYLFVNFGYVPAPPHF